MVRTYPKNSKLDLMSLVETNILCISTIPILSTFCYPRYMIKCCFNKVLKAFPVVACPLTAPVKPSKQYTPCSEKPSTPICPDGQWASDKTVPHPANSEKHRQNHGGIASKIPLFLKFLPLFLLSCFFLPSLKRPAAHGQNRPSTCGGHKIIDTQTRP